MTIQKANPSIVVDFQAPEFIRSDYAKFITFLQKYYQYLEQSNKALGVIRNLETYSDIDEQEDDDILTTFYTLFLPDFPQVLKADKKFVLKNIVEFYNSKGSIDSIKSFFRILYGEEVQVYLPKEDVLKLDAGIWTKVFKVKVYNISSGTIDKLVNSEIYQLDPVNGNTTVKARVIDYDPTDGVLYLSADNVILNFASTALVYATNADGVAVTFNLRTQLGETTTTYPGIGIDAGDSAILYDAESNTERIKVETVKKGFIQDLVLLDQGDDYSIFDTISFGTPEAGEIPATARIATTINKDLASESGEFQWAEQEDKLLFEDDFEMRQEYGNFGSEQSTPNLKVSDETPTNINTGSISSAEFGFLLENQNDEIVTYSRASYTYNQGLFRSILPRVGATSNYSINWARNEGISVRLNDEELWIGSTYCATGTPSHPGTVIVVFNTHTDYNSLEEIQATSRSSTNAPTVSVLNSRHTDEKVLDQKITGLSEHKQIGVYKFGQETLSPLYPFSECDETISSPIVYIRERNTLYGHDLNTTRPWEYRFIFKKNSVVNAKIYIMPVQYDVRATQILDEDGSTYQSETSGDDLFILEQFEQTINVKTFDPATDVDSGTDEITIANHGFKQGEIVRFNTTTDPITGVASEVMGGVANNEIFYCDVVNASTVRLIPYTTTRESLHYSLVRGLTPAATPGTTNTLCSFVGNHVTNGVDYTSTNVEDSAISIYAKKRSCGIRDLALHYNLDPNIPTDSDTNLKTTYPYTVDNKVYLHQSLVESTDYIIMERADFATSDQVNLAFEIDKRSEAEAEGYATYPYLAMENSATTVIHHNDEINIPDYSNVRVMVERKTMQSVDDINRGYSRQFRIWDDYAEYSPNQELFILAPPKYNDEYAETAYLSAVYPVSSSEYVSGPSEFSNMTTTTFVASSKKNSVYYTDGTGAGEFKYASEFDEQRRISIVEQNYYDGSTLYPTANNGPLGVTQASVGSYNTNKKKYFTIGFSLPEELNVDFDMPFEVNLRNIVDGLYHSNTSAKRDTRAYVSMQEAAIRGDATYLLESGEYLALELDDNNFNSLADGHMSTMEPALMVEFYSPSLAASDPKKHIVFYTNKADYTKVSSDIERTVYQFYNCWSPNQITVPDTTIRDYVVTVRSLQKSDTIIEKVSDSRLLASDPTNIASNVYVSPFIKDLIIRKGVNNYGRYLKFYNNTADAVADTNALTPFSLGSDFGSHLDGNEMFYNPIVSGTTVNSANNNPLNKAFYGAFIDNNVSISRFFDPAADVTTGTPGKINIPNHGFVEGSWVRFRSDFNGTVPTGLTDDTTYYIKVVNANEIRLATSKDNYDSNTFVAMTAFATAGKTCSLQTIPQSMTFNSVKENSFDIRKYVDEVQISSVDLPSSVLQTADAHTMRTLNTCTYTTTGDPIGGLVVGKVYFAIFVTETQLRLSESKDDALRGVFVQFTSSGTGSHYISVGGSNGNMLYDNTNNEFTLHTPEYRNILKNGDAVEYRQMRRLSPGLTTGDTMYVRNSVTNSDEYFSITTNEDGTSSKFGVSSTTSASVNTSNGIITFPSTHTFYTGEEVVYRGSSAIGGLTSGTTYYAIRVSSTQLKLATDRLNSYAGTSITLTTVGSGNHYFYRTNLDTLSELMEVVPLSSKPNAHLAASPSSTGTGYEEFTIIYSPTLQTEVGKIENVVLTTQGSYKKIPTVTVETPGRYGSGAELYAIVKDVGAVGSFEILDGGLHNTTRDLLLPIVFLSETTTGTFVDGETILVGATEVGTLHSVRGRYHKINPNGGVATIEYGDVITGGTSGATAVVGRELEVSAVTLSTSAVLTTTTTHYLSTADSVYITGLSAQDISDGTYYVSATSPTSFRLFEDVGLSVPLNTSAGVAYVSGGTLQTGLYVVSATASPAAITTSTANGATVNYEGDKQLINPTMKLQDSYYYQDYSYVVRGSNTFEDWKPYFNKLVHPAGMAVFGEVDYFTTNNGIEKLGNTIVDSGVINNTSTAITTEMTT